MNGHLILSQSIQSNSLNTSYINDYIPPVWNLGYGGMEDNSMNLSAKNIKQKFFAEKYKSICVTFKPSKISLDRKQLDNLFDSVH